MRNKHKNAHTKQKHHHLSKSVFSVTKRKKRKANLNEKDGK